MGAKDFAMLGIDIGGTSTKFGFVNMFGKVIVEEKIPTFPDQSAESLLHRLKNEVDSLYDQIAEQYDWIGIGVGAPNANHYTGQVVNPPNLKWGTVNLVELFSEVFPDQQTYLTNDANIAAFAEMKFGAGQGIKHFIVITLGTGLGSGIVVDDKIVHGSTGFAGELGHMTVVKDGRECGCGRKGCLETYSSANGIRRTVLELLANSNKPSQFRGVAFNEINGKMISKAAKEGDEIAKMAFLECGDKLGEALANAVTVTSPELIILVGGLAQAGKLIIDPTQDSLNRHIFAPFKNTVKVVASGIDVENVAVIGAAALALDMNSSEMDN